MAISLISFERLFRGGYRASLGPYSECGATKKAASEALLAMLANHPSDLQPSTYKTANGAVWVLWFEGRNWAYRNIDWTLGSCVVLNTRDMRKAFAMMQQQADEACSVGEDCARA